MKKAIFVTLIGLWVLLVSFFLARWRLNADTGCMLPDLPLSFWMALYDFFNAHGCESGRSVTVNVVVAISILIASTLTWIGLRLCPQGQAVLQMRQALRVSLIGIWVLVTAWFLTHWWLNAVTARVLPPPPETFRLWLLSLYGAKDVYEEQEVMALFGFAVAILIVSLLTWLVLWLWRRIKKR